MAKKKRVTFAGRLGQTVNDMANAASVAATGSECGFRGKAASDSDGRRPPIPIQSGHRFRSKAATLLMG